MARRYYANSAPQQTLQSSITSGATSATINGSFSGWPTNFPFYATIDLGGVSEEIVSVTAIVGAVATIVRGQDGTTALAHSAGATIDQTVVRQDFDEANAHVNATSGVHGLAGTLVDTSSAQTLSNKTHTAPIINGATINTSTVVGGSAQKVLSTGDASTAAVRAKAAAGGRALETQKSDGTVKFTVDGDTGNVSTPGTVASGTHNVTGDVNASNNIVGGNLTATGAVAGVSLAVSGNGTVGGTLAATGAVTGASFTANGNGILAGVVAVKQYTNETAAGTALPSPATGTLVWLTAPTGGADAGLFVWNGSAWKRTHAKIVKGTGSLVVHNGNATETTSVSFGDTFATAPIVIPTYTGTENFSCAANSPTTTGFTLRANANAGAVNTDHTVPFSYIAVGQQ